MSETLKLSGMHLQLRVQTPYDVTLTAGLERGSEDFTAADVGKVMDMLTEVAAREHLRGEMLSLRAVLKSARERLSRKEHDKAIRLLQEQRAKLDADISQKWVGSARRGEPKMSGAQKTQMEDLEKRIAQEGKMKEDLERTIPLTEWQIDCLMARMSGYSEPPMPEEVAEIVTQVEYPEDVGFKFPTAA